MAGASNLAKSGASYDLVMVDRMSHVLDKNMQKLNMFNQLIKSASSPIQKMSKRLGFLSKAGGFTALSTGITAALQVARVFYQTLRSVIATLFRIGRIAGSVFGELVTQASNATETLNAFNAVFKDQAKETNAFINRFAGAVGRSATDLRNYAKSFQAFFVGLGAAPKQAAKISRNLTRLIVDFGSFFNISDEEAFRRFIAALSGSSEVLDTFGVNIRENQLELKAQELGFGKNVRKMTELQKAYARLSIILDTLNKQGAIGDAIRTQFEWANQIKSTEGAWKDLKATVGAFFKAATLPVLRQITQELQSLKNAAVAFLEGLGDGGMQRFLLQFATLGHVVRSTSHAIRGFFDAIAKLDIARLTDIFLSYGEILGLAMVRGFSHALGSMLTVLQFQLGKNVARLMDYLEGKSINDVIFDMFRGKENMKTFMMDIFTGNGIDEIIQGQIERLERRLKGLARGSGTTPSLDDFIAQLESIGSALKAEIGKQVPSGGKSGSSGAFIGTTSSFVASRFAQAAGGNVFNKILTVENQQLQVQYGILSAIKEPKPPEEGGVFK